MSGPSSATTHGEGVTGGEFYNAANDANINKSYYNLNIVFPDVTGFFHFATKHLVALTGRREPKRDPVEISDIVPPDPSLLPPVSSIADRYTRCMLECTLGYPLYNPKPFSELSMEYPRNGVNVGDVGFVREDGTFDFLFNICPSPDCWINPPNLPNSFSLETPHHSTTRVQESLPHNKCVIPRTVKITESGEYICGGSEGAILELPEGAIRQEALKIKLFEDLAKLRGVQWYEYAMTRGRNISNGSLYLVTAFTKCIQWGIGVFDRPCDAGQGLTFVRSPFGWKGSRVFITKVSEFNQRDTPNQCVFLRGYKIKLCQDIFDNLHNNKPRSSLLTRQPAQRIRGGGGTGLWSRILTLGKPSTRTTESTVKKTEQVVLYPDFNSSPFHPSDLINTALLNENPDAEAALTHDDVWCDLMRDNFPTLNYATLMNIAQLYTSMIDEFGCVCLERISDSSNVVDERNHPGRGIESPVLQESKTGIEQPNIRVEGTPPELPGEGSFRRRKGTEKFPNFFSIRPHSRVSSKSLSQRDGGHEYLPVVDNTANPNVGNKIRFVDIKNNLGEYPKPDIQIRSVDRASKEAKGATEDTSAKLPTVYSRDKDGADKQDPQATIQASEQIGEGLFRKKFPHLDEAKRSGDHSKNQGGAGGLGAMYRQHRHVYDNSGTPEAEYREASSNQWLDAFKTNTSPITSQFQGAYDFTISGEPRFGNVGDQLRGNYLHNVVNTFDRLIDTLILKESVSFKAIHDSYAQNALAAIFFFYRSDPDRNDANRLCTTLAWQIAFSIPDTRNALIHSLIKRPDIPMKEIEIQFEELIVKPFLTLKMSGVQLLAPVVIIDGVDGCFDDNLQRRFLKLIGNAVKNDRIPLRFLICSRPEAHIRDVIDIFQSLTLPLDLAELDDANQDIEKCLRAEFSRIATEQDLDPVWPGEQIIQEFVFKASGQFGYAFIIIRRLGDEYNSAETQLDIIRGLTPSSIISPFAELDVLYRDILDRQRDPVFLKDFLSLLIGRDGIKVDDLYRDDAMLMNVSEKELHRKLRGMHSLLKLKSYIDVHHRSFLDYLQDASRSGQYHITKQAGIMRYMNLTTRSVVPSVMEQYDDHKAHFTS